ncbi:hypothetical protein niasHS_011376 [Heterodera schachtii]|uniref:Uncharacterized protein n=1 Tax=Heterodera schachtii TaxID=97005 RepID=A0ABD2IUE7_HETSC
MAVLVIILYFVCSGQCSYSSGEKYADIDGDIEAGTAHGPHRPSEIRVKFRYGSEDRDREGNRKTDHVYIVVGKYEYDYTTGGARARNKNWRKNFPTKTFSFTPRLHVDGDLKRVGQILKGMANGKWSNGSLDSFRLCLDFAYQFVCLLRNGECPPKEQWPETFTDFDRRWVRKVNGRLSVYDKRYRNSAQNSELSRDTTEVANEMPETASATVPTWLTMVEEDEYPWTLAGYFEDECV